MAQHILYVDTASGEFVSGPSNTAVAELPRLVQGDTANFRIYLLQRSTTYPLSSPYTILSTAGLALKVALGPKDGTAGSTLYAQQFVWSTDAGNQYFYASLALNTAGIGTLLGSAASASAWLEIEMSEGGLPTTVLQKQVTVHAEVIDSAVVSVPAGLTAMSAEEANAIFLKREVPGAITLVSPSGLKKVALYVDDDGVFHADPLN